MNEALLFIGYDVAEQHEIGDFLRDKSALVLFARDSEQAIRMLDENSIKSVVLNLRSMSDAVILRYINNYYPEIEVVISADNEFNEVISILKQQNYSQIPRPFSLKELSDKI